MKMFYFYLLPDYRQLLKAIDGLSATHTEKTQARTWINQTIHCTVIDTILENVNERYHQRIIARIQADPEDRLFFNLINQLADCDIESILRQRLASLHFELLKDLLTGGDK